MAAMNKTVYVVNVGGTAPEARGVTKMFLKEGWQVVEHSFAKYDELTGGVDLVCFVGGEDVSPDLYGEENTSSYCNPKRDEYEREVYGEFCSHVPFVGICRGGQFLNVMNGGKMIQHLGMTVNGDVVMEENVGSGVPLKRTTVRVDHHQGIVGTKEAINRGFIRLDEVELCADYVLWYEKTKSLCFQPHPEWGHEGTKELFFRLLSEYIFNGE